jgi:hypothetical protein
MDHIGAPLTGSAHLGHDVLPIPPDVGINREIARRDHDLHGFEFETSGITSGISRGATMSIAPSAALIGMDSSPFVRGIICREKAWVQQAERRGGRNGCYDGGGGLGKGCL